MAAGYQVFGFDIERHQYGDKRYPAELVIQDALTIHGSQFKDAALIVASPPCQQYSYMAMPWTRAKQIQAALLGEGEFPEPYTGARSLTELNALFDACFRIQREASKAAGRHIPMVVENVKGAQKWVGRATWHYGSYYLWGDVPVLMPSARGYCKQQGDPSWFYDNYKNSARRFSSKSPERKHWSAEIAKIPFPLAKWIGDVFYPVGVQHAKHDSE